MADSSNGALDLEAISKRYFAAWEARDPDAIVSLHTEDTQFWTLQPEGGGDRAQFDCLDVVNVSADGLVARKDTFVDMVQLQAALPGLDVEAEIEASDVVNPEVAA